jgi:hypothetical protein
MFKKILKEYKQLHSCIIDSDCYGVSDLKRYYRLLFILNKRYNYNI